jgi:hypothetical protein
VLTDEALLVPVGHDLGVLYPEPGSDQRRQRVRADVVELEDMDFAIWLLAHGLGDEDRPTRASLIASAQRLGLPAATIDGAVDRFLVSSEVAGQLGRTLEPAAALAQILGDLRYLIVHGCVYLDVAAASPDAG